MKDGERVMGQEGIGTMNENGMRLAEMCALNDLIICGTLFKHLDIHKLTWESPNSRDKNQIDHIWSVLANVLMSDNNLIEDLLSIGSMII